MKDDYTLAKYREEIQSAEDKPENPLSSIRPFCNGINPNNWPNVESKMNDPCLNLKYTTKWGDLMPDCQKRILDLYADTNEIKKMLKYNKEKEHINSVLAWLILMILESKN